MQNSAVRRQQVQEFARIVEQRNQEESQRQQAENDEQIEQNNADVPDVVQPNIQEQSSVKLDNSIDELEGDEMQQSERVNEFHKAMGEKVTLSQKQSRISDLLRAQKGFGILNVFGTNKED